MFVMSKFSPFFPPAGGLRLASEIFAVSGISNLTDYLVMSGPSLGLPECL